MCIRDRDWSISLHKPETKYLVYSNKLNETKRYTFDEYWCFFEKHVHNKFVFLLTHADHITCSVSTKTVDSCLMNLTVHTAFIQWITWRGDTHWRLQFTNWCSTNTCTIHSYSVKLCVITGRALNWLSKLVDITSDTDFLIIISYCGIICHSAWCCYLEYNISLLLHGPYFFEDIVTGYTRAIQKVTDILTDRGGGRG